MHCTMCCMPAIHSYRELAVLAYDIYKTFATNIDNTPYTIAH